jgi:hypothetical protein
MVNLAQADGIPGKADQHGIKEAEEDPGQTDYGHIIQKRITRTESQPPERQKYHVDQYSDQGYDGHPSGIVEEQLAPGQIPLLGRQPEFGEKEEYKIFYQMARGGDTRIPLFVP